MDHKQAAEILIKLKDKDLLSDEEKQALDEAIGVLSWTYLAKSRIRDLRAKKELKEK